MKKIKLMVVVVFTISLLLAVGCGNGSMSDLKGPQKITAQEAKDLIDKKDYDIILDVRTEEEYGEEHIENAMLLPDYEIASRAKDVLVDQDARILIYCRSGRRSSASAQQLYEMGYTNVYDFGGIIDWPYEIVSE